MAKKKKKRSTEEMLRQVQDSLQALPYVVNEHRQQGRWFKAFMLDYVSAPMLRLMNRALGARRYKGVEGQKRKQTDHMRRHLQQKQAARKHVQDLLKENEPAEVARQVSAMRRKAAGTRDASGKPKKSGAAKKKSS